MSEPLLTDNLPFDVEEKYLKWNVGLQRAMLLAVEHCYCADYQKTLDCSLKLLEGACRQRQGGEPFIASLQRVLTKVVSSCFESSREETLCRMQALFSVMDAELSAEHEARCP